MTLPNDSEQATTEIRKTVIETSGLKTLFKTLVSFINEEIEELGSEIYFITSIDEKNRLYRKIIRLKKLKESLEKLEGEETRGGVIK